MPLDEALALERSRDDRHPEMRLARHPAQMIARASMARMFCRFILDDKVRRSESLRQLLADRVLNRHAASLAQDRNAFAPQFTDHELRFCQGLVRAPQRPHTVRSVPPPAKRCRKTGSV